MRSRSFNTSRLARLARLFLVLAVFGCVLAFFGASVLAAGETLPSPPPGCTGHYVYRSDGTWHLAHSGGCPTHGIAGDPPGGGGGGGGGDDDDEPDPEVVAARQAYNAAAAELREAQAAAEGLSDVGGYALQAAQRELAAAASALDGAGQALRRAETAALAAEEAAIRAKAAKVAGADALAAATVGDPVALAIGAFRLSERDASFKVGALSFECDRHYDSSSGASGSFGPGWTSGLDTRILRGYDADAEAAAVAAEASLSEVRAIHAQALADWTRAHAELEAARLSLEAPAAAALDAVQAAARAVQKSQLANDYGLERAQVLLAQAQDLLDSFDGPTGSRTQVRQALILLDEGRASLDQTALLIDELEAAALAARDRADMAAANRALATASAASPPAWLEGLGNETFVLIDEAGQAWRFDADRAPDCRSGVLHPDGSRNYWPGGMLGLPEEACLERLELLGSGGFVRTLADGSIRYYDWRGLPIGARDRVGLGASFEYSGGALTRIDDGQGRALSFERESASGRILAITDAIGRVWRYAYDEAGRLLRVVDPSGAERSFAYSGILLSSIREADGATRSVSYERLGRGDRVVETRDEEGSVERFRYADDGAWAEFENPSGIVERHHFDGRGRTVSIAYADGAERTYAYDERGRLVEERDELGALWTYAYDGRGNRVSERSPSGAVRAWSYDGYGQVREAVDAAGGTTRYAFDGNGSLVGLTYPDGASVTLNLDERGLVASMLDARGGRTEYAYDAWGGLARVEHPDGAVERFVRDAAGRVLERVDEAGLSWRYEYDADDHVLRAVDPLGREATRVYSPRKDLVLERDRTGAETRFVYDKRHLLRLSVDGAGVARAYEYRADGRRLSELLGHASLLEGRSGESLDDWTFVAERSTELAWDARGRLARRSIADSDVAFEYRYDACGRQLAETDACGTERRQELDAEGRVLREYLAGDLVRSLSYDTRGLVEASVDALGVETRYEHDAAARLVLRATRDDSGTLVSERLAYDGSGELIARIDGLGRRTGWERDARGRVLREIGPDSGAESYGYDARGLRISATDRTGRETRYEYDTCGQLVASVDPLGATTSFVLDAEGRLVASIDAEGAERRYALDGAGRVVAEYDPYGNATRYELDADGQAVAVLDPLGGRATIDRDAAGRPLRSTDPSGRSQAFAWDAAGRLLERRTGTSLIERFAYDAAGRLVREERGGEVGVYEWDARGDLIGSSRPGQPLHRYARDYAGRIVSETDRLGALASYRYDAAGQLVSATSFDGARSEFRYDERGRLIRADYADGAWTSFAYDAEGRLLKAENPAGTLEFAYDGAGRLLASHDRASGIETRREYDRVGRETALIQASGTTRRRYGKAGELIELRDASGGTTSYAYDAALREVERAISGGLSTRTRYDAAGRIIAIAHDLKSWGQEKRLPSEAYVYDDAGRKRLVLDAEGRVSAFSYDDAGRLISASYPLDPSIVQSALRERLDLGLLDAKAWPHGGGPGRNGDGKDRRGLGGLESPEIPKKSGGIEAYPGSGPDADLENLAQGILERLPSGASEGGIGFAGNGFAPRLCRESEWLGPVSLSDEEAVAAQAALSLLGSTFARVDRRQAAWREAYEYDASGNRAAKANALGAIKSAYDAEDRLLLAGRRDYAYDARGRLVSEILDGVETRYGYDAQDRMVSASLPGLREPGARSSSRIEMTYAYDALGRRASATRRDLLAPSGRETRWRETDRRDERYAYDGLGFERIATLVDEARGHGSEPDILAFAHTWAKGFLLASADLDARGGARRFGPSRPEADYYATDTLGSARALVDGQGHVKESLRYDAFGRIIVTTMSDAPRFAFAGKPLDPATGLEDFGYRDYSPESGRFQTRDPLGDGLNPYLYCRGDPINLLDLLGLAASDLYLQQAHLEGGRYVADYPVSCKLFGAHNGLVMSGEVPVNLAGNRAERMSLRLVDEDWGTNAILSAEFDGEVVREVIPAGLSQKEVERIAAGRPVVVIFSANEYWGQSNLPKDLEHGVTLVDGIFKDPYSGRSGTSLSSTRGGRSTVDFSHNLGGYVYSLRKKEEDR